MTTQEERDELRRRWSNGSPNPLGLRLLDERDNLECMASRILGERRELEAEVATLKKERDELARKQEHPHQMVYPCGCITCVCENDVRCGGCGAQSCGQPGALSDHIPSGKPQRVKYLVAEVTMLRAENERLKATASTAREYQLALALQEELTHIQRTRSSELEAENEKLKAELAAAKEREERLTLAIEDACKRLCCECSDLGPPRPGKYRSHEWWHDVGECQLRCLAESLRAALAPTQQE